jgi:hypothetical protein
VNWQPAVANNSLTLGVGIVQNASGSPTTFDLVYTGPITGITGISATPLVPGDYYFVDPLISGNLTNVPPSTNGQFTNPILVATDVDKGIVLQYRPAAVATSLPSAGAVIIFGVTSFANGTSTQFFIPGGPSSAATASGIVVRSPRNATVQSLVGSLSTANTGANATVTLLVNGVASALTATVTNGATTFQNLTNTVAVTQGDSLTLQLVGATGFVSGTNCVVAFELA